MDFAVFVLLTLCSLVLAAGLLLRAAGEKSPGRASDGESGFGQGSKTVRCIRCGRELSVPFPVPSNIKMCPGCGLRFVIVLWDSDQNLFMSALDEEGGDEASPGSDRKQPADFLEALGFEAKTDVGRLSLKDIRSAYYKAIRSYHPDKYASLPSEFQQVAHKKTRELNEAYMSLVKLKSR